MQTTEAKQTLRPSNDGSDNNEWFEPDWHLDKRRKPPSEKKSWRPKQLWARHHEIKRRLLLGQSNKQIAEALGIHPQTVSWVRNSPVMQKALKELSQKRDEAAVDLKNQIMELAPLAIKHYKRCLEDETNEVYSTSQQLKIAGDVLDRSGLSPKQVSRHEHLHAHLTTAEIEEIKRRAREDSERSGLLTVVVEDNDEGNGG